MSDPIKVFVSYSHQDAEYLARDSLLGFLKGLEKTNVEFWTDQQIRPGELWDEVIKANLQDAQIALVLVSQAFLDSAYCQDVEIEHLLAGKKHLIPVILSPCDWKRHPWLRERQFLPGGDRTLETDYTEPGPRKQLFLQIREALRERVELIRQAKSEPSGQTKPGEVRFSGKKRVEFCRRLGDDWRDLAEYLEIPAADQARFERGDEARAILTWLENRRRQAQLPGALKAIGRPELALILKPPPTPSVQESRWQEGSPYPGLRPFTAEYAPVFFGRNRNTASLIAKLQDPVNRFLAVVGASGSGKSSLVAAGLLPRLKEDAIPGSKDWLVLELTPGGPGNDPFPGLAYRLEPLFKPYGLLARDIDPKLRAREGLAELLGQALARQEQKTLLLFIDQFEELFTLCDEKHQSPFINMLDAAVRTAGICVVITLRSDFFRST